MVERILDTEVESSICAEEEGGTYGTVEGESCDRWGGSCEGIIKLQQPENCSCHINAPCSACMHCKHFCPVCGWEEEG